MPPVLKTLTGIVYPKLIPGKGPAYRPLPRKKHDGDKSFYTEPQVMVNEHDLASWNNLRGVPLIFEHGQLQEPGNPVVFGHTVDTTVQSDDSVFYVANIYDTPEGRWAAEKIECGIITGLSIGYGLVPDPSNSQIAAKRIDEVSMVLKPYFEGATLRVCATGDDGYIAPGQECCVDRLKLMEPATTTPTTPAVRDAAAEIAQAAADIQLKQARDAQEKAQKELERMAKEKEAADKELAAYRAEKHAQLQAKAQDRVKEVDNALVNVQRALGVEKLPEAFVEANRNIAHNSVFMDSNNAHKAAAEVTASMTALIGKRMGELVDEQKKKDEEFKQLQAKYAELEATLKQSRDRVQASRNALYENPAPTPSEAARSALASAVPVPQVQASGHGSHITDILVVPMVKPNTPEGRLCAQANPDFGMDSPSQVLGVHASAAIGTTGQATVAVKRAPTHRYMEHVQDGLRGRKGENGEPYGEAWFGHYMSRYNPTMGMVGDKYQVSMDNDSGIKRTF